MKRKLIPLLLAVNIFMMTACGEEEVTMSTNAWIDSDIEGFVTEETVVSEKDDFAVAANKELILSENSKNTSLGSIAKEVLRKKREPKSGMRRRNRKWIKKRI